MAARKSSTTESTPDNNNGAVTNDASRAPDGDAAAWRPRDVVAERLDDPAVAASLVTLLDNVELISTLTIGLNEFISRSDVIVDNIAASVDEFRATGATISSRNAPSLADIGQVTRELSAAAPALRAVLNSPMTDPATIELLSTLSEAATQGAARARDEGTKVGTFGLMGALRDDDVQRGMGLMVEIARAIGQRIKTPT